MSLPGNINRILKKLNSGQLTPTPAEQSIIQAISEPIGNTSHKIIIEAINETDDILEPFTCVSIIAGATALVLPEFIYPDEEDELELALYGSLLHKTHPGQVGHVQISGRATFRIKAGDVLIDIGEILYPLFGDTDKGLIGNKASEHESILDTIPLGRALESEHTDTELISLNLSGTGGGSENDVMVVDLASTANFATLSGNPTVDGVSTAGAVKKILAKNQSVASQRKVYETKADGSAWKDLGQPKVIEVLNGALSGRTRYMLTSTNTYQGGLSFYG